MRQKLKITMTVACLYLTGAGTASAQWVVPDSGNLAQSIVNSAKGMVETADTRTNALNGFLKTQRIFQQEKRYYDALKSVHDVVRDGVKASKSISLAVEISEIYVDNYRHMLSGKNYTPGELTAISSGYAMLIDESSNVLQDLKNMVDVTGMSPPDAERLAIVENAYRSLMNCRNLVRYYTNKTISVNCLRARKKNDMDRIMSLYGTTSERYW